MKTRRFLGWVAMATMVLSTGCSNDELVNDYSPKNAIQFSTYMGRNVQSRAAELTTPGLQVKGFGVFAFYTGQYDWTTKNPVGETATSTPNFMFNQEVTYTEGTDDGAEGFWEYSPVKYWPETRNDKISFFAYGPYLNYAEPPVATVDPLGGEGVAPNAKAGAPTVKFTQSTDVTQMVDFVAGVAMDQTGSSDNYATTESKTVDFTLKHELTRLNFAAKLDRNAFVSDGTKKNQTRINITSVKINEDDESKFYQSADYTFATTNDDESNTFKGTWSSHVVATTDLILDDILNTSDPSGIGTGENAYTTSGIMLEGTAETALFKGKVDANDNAASPVEAQAAEYVFLIPPVQQDGTTGLGSGDIINVTFSYDIITMDEKLAIGYIKTSATKTVPLPTGAEDDPDTEDVDESKENTLQQGKAYKFIFTFGLHEVKVSAEVDLWGTKDSDGGTNVDWTDTDAGSSSSGGGTDDSGSNP